MKRALPVLMSFCLILSLASGEDIGQTIEDLELNLEIQGIIIENAEAAGKDVSAARGILSEFEDAVDNLQDAHDEHGEGIEVQRAQMAVWEKLTELQEEYENMGLDLKEGEDKDAKESVEEAMDGLDVHFEVLDTLLEVADLQGKDTVRARNRLAVIREHYENMVELYEDGEYKEAQRELFRLYIAMPELQEELEGLEIGEEEDNRPIKERIEDVLTKFEYPLQVLELLLDNAEAEGKDTGTARETLEEMGEILEDVHDLYDGGDYEAAWRKVMRLFVLGVRIQNDFRDLGIELEDDRTSEEKVKEALEEFEVHEESIKFVFRQARKKGRDISRAETLFNEMKDLMEQVEAKYEDGEYEEAEMVLLQVFLRSPEFQEEFQKVVRSLEETPEEMRAKLEETLEEYDANIPLIEQMIDAAERQGKDVERIRELLGKFKGYMEQVRAHHREGEYKDAQRQLQRAYIIANDFKKEFEKLEELDVEEIRENINKAQEGIGFAKDILRELRRAGLDTAEADSLVEKIEDRMDRVESLYDQGKYKEASQELMRAFSLGAKLQSISGELIKEYEGGNK